MSRRIEYQVNGRLYPTQVALEAEIRDTLGAQNLDEPFTSAFLAAVLNTLDERIRASGQQATGAFERLSIEEQERRGLEPRPGPLLMAEFEPSGKWLPCSAFPWRRRPRDYRDEIKEALRELLALYLPRPGPSTRCAECFSVRDLQPWWDEGVRERIAEECLDLMTPEEVAGRFGFNRFSIERDNLAMLLPAAHPAVRHLLQSHAKYEWRCRLHAQALPVSVEPAPIRFSVPSQMARQRVQRALAAHEALHGHLNPVEALKRQQETNERARRQAEERRRG